MSKDLLSLLMKMELSADEAEVLLTLYQHPCLSAGRIAQFSRFKRGHTYNIISALLAQGLVSEVIERGVKRFSAVPPSQLPMRIEKKRDELAELLVNFNRATQKFEDLIPKLHSLPRVQVYRGISGVKELYQFTLSSKEKVIRACADFSMLFPRKRNPELNDWLWDYASRRASKGILYRGIVSRSSESDIAFKKRHAQKRELRILDQGALPAEINIFDRYVIICSTAQETMGILVESEPIAETAKVLFDAFWKVLPSYSIS